MTTTTIQFVTAPAAADLRGISFLDADGFTAMCPTCNDVRFQRGYTIRWLLRQLIGNQRIEAYCVVCAAYWPISLKERRALAERIAAVPHHGQAAMRTGGVGKTR